MRPKVYLVGAGPGAEDLLTLRALKVLEKARVVLYDRLVNPKVLALAPGAEKVYVGKEEGESAKQEEIHALLLYYAQKHGKAVRLKGGDPFVFGRGGEELAFLLAHGVEVEVVPGLSSALALPALAGLPLTHRGLAQGFAVLPGVGEKGQDPDLRPYAQVPTLVLLMGVKQRARIAQALIRLGRSPEEPSLFIEKGSTLEERRVYAPLKAVAAGEVEVFPPAVWVIGNVVGAFLPLVQGANPLQTHREAVCWNPMAAGS